MAVNASEVVSLIEAKRELRLDADDTEQDAMLENQIEAAVAMVASILGIPIIDEVNTYTVPMPVDSEAPAVVDAPAAIAVRSIRYWLDDETMKHDPSGVVEIGRVELPKQFASRCVVYPLTEWPEAETPCLSIAIQQGVVFAESDPQSGRTQALIKQGVMLAVRRFYDGAPKVEINDAVKRTLAPLRQMRVPVAA